MNLSRVPPLAKIASTEWVKNPSSTSATSSGGRFSAIGVKPTTSANSTVTRGRLQAVRRLLGVGPFLRHHQLDHRRGVVALQPAAHLLLELDALGVADALHRHRRVVGERGEEVEVPFVEGAGVERRVHLHDADDVVARPQRRAHRRADVVDADRLAGGEALVGLRVVGEQRHALLDHRLQHGARHRHLGGPDLHLVADARQLADQLAGAVVAQQDEAAVDGERLEADGDHRLEHLVGRVGADQQPRQPRHDAEDGVAVGLVERLALVLAAALGGEDLLEPVVGREVGKAADDGGRRDAGRRMGAAGRHHAGLVERRRRSRLVGELALDEELEDADLEAVSGAQRRLLDGDAVDLHAVGALEVVDEPAARLAAQRGVAARHREVGQHDVVVAAATEADLVALQGEEALPAVDDAAEPEHRVSRS